MSNDGKLGLLAGVAVVLLVAVVAHRKGLTTPAPLNATPAKASVGLPPPPVSVVPGANPTPNADPLLRGSTD